MTKINKRIVILFSVVLLLTALLAGLSSTVTPRVGAVVLTDNNFDKTKIEDDLAHIDLSQYPKDANGTPRLIQLVEYCYSDNAFKCENYGLYFYVYNPSQMSFSMKDGANVVNMAIGYDAVGKPINYDNVGLNFLTKTVAEGTEGLFYKFKVSNAAALLETATAYNKAHKMRRYDITGIQLREVETGQARDYGFSYTYTYTGYAKGYGIDTAADSTLDCEIKEMETVELSPVHTYYRTGVSDKGRGHQNQIDSVYFAVPNRFIETYGKLQRIKAEWYEYRTQDILVTSYKDFYDTVLPYIGKYVEGQRALNADLQYPPWEIGYGVGVRTANAVDGIAYNSVWNVAYGARTRKYIDYLNYLFLVADITKYDPNASGENVGSVAGNDLYDYIVNYDKSYDKGRLPIKNGEISADLFEDGVDEGRTKGYNVKEFDAETDLFSMKSYEDGNPSFWDKWREFGFWDVIFGNLPELDESYDNVSPIVWVQDEDLQYSDEEIAKRLLIRVQDVPKFKAYYNEASDKNAVFLFRFATTDYYADNADIFRANPDVFGVVNYITEQAYIAQETVFLDFDIISLTFNKDGDYTVIPVVMNPIDIVPDITTPIFIPEGCNELPRWLIIAIIVVCCILFLPVIIALLPSVIKLVAFLVKWIFKILWWIISAPFRLAAWIVGKVKGSKE